MKHLVSIAIFLLVFTACDKEGKAPVTTTLPIGFTASVSGNERSFMDHITCKSERITKGGNHFLSIWGNHKIGTDSFTQIRFTVLDFTRDGITEEKTYALTNNFTGNFVEWKDVLNATHGKYHFFQHGQLKLTKIGADYISGQFQFVYYTFDRYGNKTGEVTVTDGAFKNLKINRIN